MDLASIILLGLVQGVTEWVPVSSKTQDAFVYLHFLGGSPDYVVPILLYLHLGTLIAAALYFRKELAVICRKILSKPLKLETYARGKVGFLLAALFCTGVVGFPIFYLEKKLFPDLNASGIYLLMGAGLILTGMLLLSQRKKRLRTSGSVGFRDGILTGLMQGLSTLPGVSRAGTTSTALIWRSFDAESAFNLSFLLSIPSVALTEVVFYIGKAAGSLPFTDGIALSAASFVFGYLTLDIILRLVKKVNLSYVTIALGVLIIISAAFNAG